MCSEDDRVQELFSDLWTHLAQVAKKKIKSGGSSLRPSDLVQDTFLKVLAGHRSRWNSDEHFYGYFVETLHSVYVDYERKKGAIVNGGGVRHLSLEHHFALGDDPRAPMHSLGVADLESILGGVSPSRRRAILARVWFPWSQRETAEKLGIPREKVAAAWAWFELRLRRELGLSDEDDVADDGGEVA